MTSWTSYPKLYALGHPKVMDLFRDTVIVEEKVDGSQFSFGVHGGELHCKSKGAIIDVSGPGPDLFRPAVAMAKRLHGEGRLPEGYTFRGEAMCRPKHNTLAYDRAPRDGFILFDVATGPENYMNRGDKERLAERMEMEIVPVLFEGVITGKEDLMGLMNTISRLGGQKVEGVVIKNYARFTDDSKPCMAKLVSEAFKEVHKGEWRKSNPTGGDIIDLLAAQYRTPSRWHKAVQHLREAGKLTESHKDIGPLIEEIKSDVRLECEHEIRDALMKWAWDKMARKMVDGAAQWYKNVLVEAQFSGHVAVDDVQGCGPSVSDVPEACDGVHTFQGPVAV